MYKAGDHRGLIHRAEDDRGSEHTTGQSRKQWWRRHENRAGKNPKDCFQEPVLGQDDQQQTNQEQLREPAF